MKRVYKRKVLSETIDSLIGALMNSEAKEEELAFNYAVEQINGDLTLLPQTTLIPHIEHIDSRDSFRLHRKGFAKSLLR